MRKLILDGPKYLFPLIEEIESRFLNKKRYKFGYEKSESLFVLENSNIPNNVFPVFWWPFNLEGERKRITIFKRL